MEQKVFFTNSKGIKLCGILSTPSRNTDTPIVIMCHGYPGSDKNSSTNIAMQERLNAKGIATFRFDFYSFGESEGTFEEATLTECVDDLEHAIDFVHSKGFKTVGLLGSSFGGEVSIIVAGRRNDIAVLALKSAVSKFDDRVHFADAEIIRKWKELGYREYVETDGTVYRMTYEFYEDTLKYDGYELAKSITIPVVLVHGDNDDEVPVEQSIKLSKMLPNAQLHIVEGADHRYSNEKHKHQMLDTIEDFLVKQLQSITP